MDETQTTQSMPQSVDLNEIAKTNTAVHVSQVAAAMEAVKTLSEHGVVMSQFELVLPFTRIRSAQRRWVVRR